MSSIASTEINKNVTSSDVESMFIKLDINEDNVIDNLRVVAHDGIKGFTELDLAFRIYRSEIIKAANLDATEENYAQSIFLYIMKYNKIPSPSFLDRAKVFELYNFGSKEPIFAGRGNIETMLNYLGN